MSYKIFTMDLEYPWDIYNHTETETPAEPWHIAHNIEEFCGYIKAFGIPSSVSLFGAFGPDAAAWLIDTCRDMGIKFPTYYGSSRALEYIENARLKGLMHT